MPAREPEGTTNVDVEGLGKLQGLVYTGGVQQFCGVPYGRLVKRWTRAALADSWADGFHDGTNLGFAAPNPPEYDAEKPDLLTPVPDFAHFPRKGQKELECLVMNIVTPPSHVQGPFPVMVYIHGGSFVYGGANEPIFDAVNLVSYSIERGTPVVAVNFNYRVGYGGFLASEEIRDDLERDGHCGVGNFGLTDQQTALEWVQRYISNFQGDKNNVMIYGLSAGGVSVAYQTFAATPATFHRAVSMSGNLNTILACSLEEHEKRYQALLKYLKIDGLGALDRLRALPDHVVAAATIPVEGAFVCTMNPCNDGVFLNFTPSTSKLPPLPSWLQSYMAGHTFDEAIIVREQIQHLNFKCILEGFLPFMPSAQAEALLELYGISAQTPNTAVPKLFEDMCSDSSFVVQDYLHVHQSSRPQTYAYHWDQVSTLDNALKGTAYHAIDLLYVFMNLFEEMTPQQIELARKVAGDYIDFAWGKDPFERFNVAKRWMVYGPDDGWGMKSEEEDEPVRNYERIKEVIGSGVLDSWVTACAHVALHRHAIGAISNQR